MNYWDWTTDKTPANNIKSATNLYGNTSVSCPDDSKVDTWKYVWIGGASAPAGGYSTTAVASPTKWTSATCQYGMQTIATGEEKKVV